MSYILQKSNLVILLMSFLFLGCYEKDEDKPSSTSVDSRVKYDDVSWPNGDISKVSSPFGPRWKVSEERYDFHRGIDIAGEDGDLIYSIADGEVDKIVDPVNDDDEHSIRIKHTADTPFSFHGESISTYYSWHMHVDASSFTSAGPNLKVGDSVSKGQAIAVIGQSGPSTFTHNHFEIRLGITCSREYQRSYSTNNCSTSFAETFPNATHGTIDPHINPMLLLQESTNDNDSITVNILSSTPLKIQIISPREEIDINEVVATQGNTTKTLNLNTREGIGSYGPLDYEDIEPDWTLSGSIDNSGVENTANVIAPSTDTGIYFDFSDSNGRFTNNGGEDYELIVIFSDLNGYDSITIKDIWGKTIKSLSN